MRTEKYKMSESWVSIGNRKECRWAEEENEAREEN